MTRSVSDRDVERPLARRRLGRTSLRTTVMGFGTGGFSRAGLRVGADHAASIVTTALEAGINVIDTAEAYGTESVVAEGIAQSGVPRSDVIIATKVRYRNGDRLRSPEAVVEAVHGRLDALRTDYLDVLQIHGVQPADYAWARDTLRSVLERLRDQGMVRWIGISEVFALDPTHVMLSRAITDGCWDTVMVGYNLANQTALHRVIAPAAAADIGVLVMFAVRDALADIDRFDHYLREQAAAERLPGDFDIEGRLAKLREVLQRESSSLADLAYRFAAAPPGVSTVLVGTGNRDHLAANRASLGHPPLAAPLLTDLRDLFEGVDTLSGQSAGPNTRAPG